MLTRIQSNKRFFPLIIIAAWTVFGVFFGTQTYLREMYAGKGASLAGLLVSWVVCGYCWAILTVPVIRIARRFSLEKMGWARFIASHVPLAAGFAFLQLGIYVALASLLFGTRGRGMWEFYKMLAVNEFQTSFLVYFVIVSAVTAFDRLTRNENPCLSRPPKSRRMEHIRSAFP